MKTGQTYVRVTDLNTVPVGARLRQDHPNHMSVQLHECAAGRVR